MEGDLGQEAEMCWGSFTLAYQEGNTLPSNGCLADTETQVTQQPHQGGVGGRAGGGGSYRCGSAGGPSGGTTWCRPSCSLQVDRGSVREGCVRTGATTTSSLMWKGHVTRLEKQPGEGGTVTEQGSVRGSNWPLTGDLPDWELLTSVNVRLSWD